MFDYTLGFLIERFKIDNHDNAINHRLVAIEVTEGRHIVDHGSRVHGNCQSRQGPDVDKEFVREQGIRQGEFRLYCDNQSAIHLAKNVTYHSRTKHIQRRHHWLREQVEEGNFALMKIHTTQNGSDMLAKVLSA